MERIRRRAAILVGVLLVAVGCTAGTGGTDAAGTSGAPEAGRSAVAGDPGSPVPAATPSAPSPTGPAAIASGSPAAVDLALDEVRSGDAPLTGVAVMHRGSLVGDAYRPGVTADAPQPVWSVTKSVVSALVGIAVAEGLLDLDTTLDVLFGAAASGHAEVTVEHLLTMTSGLDLPETEAAFRDLHGSDDWVASILSRPAASPPGATFRYCSACVHLLTAALHRITGDLPAWAEHRLFGPLGLGPVGWEVATDGSGAPVGGWGMAMTATQLARFGELYRRGGSWAARQLVPEDWVAASVSAQGPAGEPFEAWQVGYGYLWWVRDAGGYAATGRGGQLIVVVPDSELVIGATADLSDEEAFRSFAFVWSRIVAAFPLSAAGT